MTELFDFGDMDVSEEETQKQEVKQEEKEEEKEVKVKKIRKEKSVEDENDSDDNKKQRQRKQRSDQDTGIPPIFLIEMQKLKDEISALKELNTLHEQKIKEVIQSTNERLTNEIPQYTQLLQVVQKALESKKEEKVFQDPSVGMQINELREKINSLEVQPISSPLSIVDEDKFIKWVFEQNLNDNSSNTSLKWIQKYKRKYILLNVIRLVNKFISLQE